MDISKSHPDKTKSVPTISKQGNKPWITDIEEQFKPKLYKLWNEVTEPSKEPEIFLKMLFQSIRLKVIPDYWKWHRETNVLREPEDKKKETFKNHKRNKKKKDSRESDKYWW